MSAKLNLAGQRFGRLTVLAKSRYVNHQTRWECICDCGNKCEVKLGNLRNGHSRSCGCIAVERISNLRKTHGKSRTPEFRTWCKMRERCENPNVEHYPQYGGRGIKVCERWLDFKNFIADMGPRPTLNHSIDRFPNQSGNYEPGNCRWATAKEQQNNRSDNKVLTHEGLSMTASEWARRIGIAPNTIHDRLRRGWDTAKAITTPIL